MSETLRPEQIPENTEFSPPTAHVKEPKSRRRDKTPLHMQVILYLRWLFVRLQVFVLRNILGMDVHPDTRISLRANLDFTNPRGVHIGEGTLVAFHATILTHDMCRVWHTDTYVGKNCFIGAYSMIMPGVRIGDSCIIGSGSVITRDVPSNSIVAGNPAKVIRSGIRTMRWGVLEDAYREAVEAIQRSTQDEP